MKRFLAIALLTLSMSACSTTEELETEVETQDAAEVVMNELTLVADLSDVNTEELIGAAALIIDKRGQSFLSANAELPALEDGFFYEGWLVRTEPLSVVSTGAMTEGEDATFMNDYFASEDYSDHPQYIITLEPDDGDPAPAEHVAEGTLTK